MDIRLQRAYRRGLAARAGDSVDAARACGAPPTSLPAADARRGEVRTGDGSSPTGGR
jgi:hypothetical protein